MHISVYRKVLKTKTKDIVCKCSHSGESGLRDVSLSYFWKVISKVTLILATA